MSEATMEAVNILNRLDLKRLNIALDWLKAFERDEDVETFYDTVAHFRAIEEYERGEAIDEDEIERRLNARREAV